MNLTDERLKELDDPSLSRDARVVLRSRLAAELIHGGQYEAAREALGELWPGVGVRPDTEGLRTETAAELLLRCGALSSWLGHIRHIPGAQEKAKDLIFEALRVFRSEGRHAKASEAHYELGMCYFWLGAYDDARVVLDQALDGLGPEDAELTAHILIRRSVVEVWTGRYRDAWDALERAKEFFEASSDAVKGRWHGQRGLVLRKIATAERRSDYADRAIIEFTAAIHYYERAGHERHAARNYNNLAMLLYQFGRYADAHENLDRARHIFTTFKDPGSIAQVDETRVRVLVAERKYVEANRIIGGVIGAFEEGGDAALLADALTLQGTIAARLGDPARSVETLTHAVQTAEDAGALANAGRAALTLIEEHGARTLAEDELLRHYRRAHELLRETEDVEDLRRLRECALIVVKRVGGAGFSDPGFSLATIVHGIEARFIERALKQAEGSVTRAAQLLGIPRQSLSNLLRSRHRNLLDQRTPAKTRRRSIMKGGRRHTAAPRLTTIFHAEDNRLVADAVRSALEVEGWRVVSCPDGTAALKAIESSEPYDLLLLDYDLPSVDGLELVRRARRLPHRRRTPIIMFSATECERAAWQAGVDAFLAKPDDPRRVTDVVARLLPKRSARKAR